MRRCLNHFKGLLFLGALIFAMQACYYDNEEDLYQNFPQDCDVTDVTYSIEVSAIMANNCVDCHSGSNPFGSLDLTTYDNVMRAAADIKDRINRPTGAAGVMPTTGPMNQCDIDKVNAWVDAGAPNN